MPAEAGIPGSLRGPADPFAALADLAREEHALVVDGRFEELADLDLRRRTVLERLPADTPPEAEQHVREAARLQALVTVALRDALAATRAELVRLDGARDGAAGYGGPGVAARPRFDAAG